MAGRYVYCPAYDDATATCTVAHEYVESPGILPPLSAADGAAVGKAILFAFAVVYVTRRIADAVTDRV